MPLQNPNNRKKRSAIFAKLFPKKRRSRHDNGVPRYNKCFSSTVFGFAPDFGWRGEFHGFDPVAFFAGNFLDPVKHIGIDFDRVEVRFDENGFFAGDDTDDDFGTFCRIFGTGDTFFLAEIGKLFKGIVLKFLLKRLKKVL